MEQLELAANSRSETGKEAAKHLRAQGFIPAVVYGEGKENVLLRVSAKDISHLFSTKAKEHAIIKLKLDDGRERMVILKEKQIHPVSDKFLHCDFYQINLNKLIKTKVSIKLTGNAAGVKVGGIMEQIVREVEVESLPIRIPEYIEADVSSLQAGQILYLKDLKEIEGVTILGDPEQLIATIITPKAVEEEIVPETQVKEPEVISERKEEKKTE